MAHDDPGTPTTALAAPGLTGDDRYRLLVESISDYAIYMLDADGVVTSWNLGAQRFKGYEPQEIIGQHFSRFYTDEDREAGLPARALAAAATEGRFEAEGWRVRKDGVRFWAHVVIDPIRLPDGSMAGFAKITRDLTERRHAQEALRSSEEQFKLLVQGVTDYAIYMLDAHGLVASWNAGAERIKGYTQDEIIGSHVSRFYTPEDAEAGMPELSLRIAATEGRYEKEGWRVRKSGERFWAHVIIDVIRNPDGTILGFAKITRDITERRESQRALELAQQALFQSQKLDSIGQLTGGIAHDFNNLLTAIVGSLELLRKRMPDDAKTLALVDNAMQGAQRGKTLIQRMLAFARRQELTTEAVDLPALVHALKGLIERSIGPTIRIRTQFPPSLPRVMSDASQLDSALLNLVVNARDAMPEGGLITIAARQVALGQDVTDGLPAGCYVCLTVTDTGPGMDAATLDRAMEPFFTTKGVGKGTGLGLSMVHGLAAQTGGRLVLRSPPGEGLTAEIWLPVTEDLASVPETAFAAEEPRMTGLTILAVDDDDLVLMNTAAMLEDLGHTVVEATSGDAALEGLSRHPEIDLVISDQAMPGMTGVQLAAAIRLQRPDMPVILATGYAELPPGADTTLHRLAKPFGQTQLARALSAVRPAVSLAGK